MDFERSNAEEWNDRPIPTHHPPSQGKRQLVNPSGIASSKPLTESTPNTPSHLSQISCNPGQTYASAARVQRPQHSGQLYRGQSQPCHGKPMTNLSREISSIHNQPTISTTHTGADHSRPSAKHHYQKHNIDMQSFTANSQPKQSAVNAEGAEQEVGIEELQVETLHSLRQRPNVSIPMLYTGFLPWPSKDISHEHLGPNLSRLDRVRKDFDCHIVFEKEFSSLKLYGETSHDVSGALAAVKRVLTEALTSDFPPIAVMIADLPTDGAHMRVVMLEANGPSNPSCASELGLQHPGEIAAVVSSTTDTSYEKEWSNKVSVLLTRNVEIIRMAVTDFLGHINGNKASARMCCRLGVYIWQSYWWQPKEAKDQPVVPFVENLANEKAQGRLHHLTKRANILNKVLQSTTLCKSRPGSAKSLQYLNPFCDAHFVLEGDKFSGGAEVQLWIGTSAGPKSKCPVIVHKEWRSCNIANGENLAMRVDVARLRRGLSWSLEASLDPPATEVSEQYQNFGHSIRVDEAYRPESALDVSTPAFKFAPFPKLKLINQRTVWRFRLMEDHALILDVVRQDHFDMSRKQLNSKDEPMQAQWLVEVHHESWEGMLRHGRGSSSQAGSPPKLKLEDFFVKQSPHQSDLYVLDRFMQTMRNVVDALG